MREIKEIERSLRDAEGSCRDLNFQQPTWEGVADLFAMLGRCFSGGDVTDAIGNRIVNPSADVLHDVAEQELHARFWGGPPPVTELQVFVCTEEDGTPFVELSIFPDDVSLW